MENKKPLSNKFYTIFWACFSLFMLVVDFVSKWIVQSSLNVGEQVALIPNFLYVTLAHNTGVAFSIGAGETWSRILFICISFFISVLIAVYYFINKDKNTKFMKAILALLFAGAVGNLIDRAFYWEATTGFDGVIDFIQFYLGGGPSASYSVVNPFATFNIADSCLTIGVGLFIVYLAIDSLKSDDKKEDLSKDPRVKESTKENNPTRDGAVKDKEADEKAASK